MPVGSKILTLFSSSFHLRHLAVPCVARYYRHPISDFSCTAVSHVRHHFLFSPTKLLLWSRVASQVHTEAVKAGCGGALTLSPSPSDSHPWPEWSKLAGLLLEKSFSDRCISPGEDDDSFLVEKDIEDEFLKDARVCLGFARARPDILRLLTKKNVEEVVLNGSPFLFRNGENSVRRMKKFLSGEASGELEVEKAQTIDLMRYLLSYVNGPLSSSDINGINSKELVERSVRKLFGELFNLSGTVWKSKSVVSTLTEVPSSNEQFWPPGQYNEMRSGNLVYPKLPNQTFVASESRSIASCGLIDVDYGKGMTCQKQGPNKSPSESCSRTLASSTFNANSAKSLTNSSQPPSHLGNNYSHTYHGEYIGKPEPPSGSFWTNSNTPYGGSTVNSSMQYNSSWSQQLTSDSSHSTNLIPPCSNSQRNNCSNILNGGPAATSSPSPGNLWSEEYCTSYSRFDKNLTPPSSNTNRPSSSPSWSNNNTFYGETSVNSSHPPRDLLSNYCTADAGKSANSTRPSSNSRDNDRGYIENSVQPPYNRNTSSMSTKENSSHPLPNSWNNHSPYGTVSTEPFINSWSNNNYSFGGPTSNPSLPPSSSWNSYTASRLNPNNYSYAGLTAANPGYTGNSIHPFNNNSWSTNVTSYRGTAANPAQTSDKNSWNNNNESWVAGIHGANTATEGLSAEVQTHNTLDSESFGYSGKSLEGSCVKEPDPLDMSEEAKAERWFRRAAQIKDISELSQIPDEDFPQIMPMRKGVNRFVVSKRKTPLERRLTSQQYKRYFPVSSDTEKEPTAAESMPSHRSDSGL